MKARRISLEELCSCIIAISTALQAGEPNEKAVAQAPAATFSGRKIMAIRAYQAIFNTSLGRAKDAIDTA